MNKRRRFKAKKARLFRKRKRIIKDRVKFLESKGYQVISYSFFGSAFAKSFAKKQELVRTLVTDSVTSTQEELMREERIRHRFGD